MYLLGLDIGSSSIKAALVDAESKKTIALTKSPELEMKILSASNGWAEQEPELWWTHVCTAIKQVLKKADINGEEIISIGISYQMHGLVLIDKNQNPLRPAIIWCDGRAVEIGRQACAEIGEKYCFDHYLNSPGNFTASKLKWVKDQEPHIYEQVDKMMLPGDYISMKLTGNVSTTIAGLSESVLWDFKNNTLAYSLLEHYGIDKALIPPINTSFEHHGSISQQVSEELGLKATVPVHFKAGDQPTNALSLNVLEPGEVAATGGTSGVIYSISDQLKPDIESRTNAFAHVNHTTDNIRIGNLLCINAAGSQYAWTKQTIATSNASYEEMAEQMKSIPIGADGLQILPFGNGSERMLNHLDIGAQIKNIKLNQHSRAHLYRATIEGIAFAFVYGFDFLKQLGIQPKIIKAGNDNLFQSSIFSQTICNLIGVEIQLMETTGAVGAALASGVGMGAIENLSDAFHDLQTDRIYEPEHDISAYDAAYKKWKKELNQIINNIKHVQ